MASDVEQQLIDLLSPVVAPAPVGTRTDSKASFVRVLRVGGAARSRVQDAALVAVEGWAPTESAALALLEKCRDYLLNEAARVTRTGIHRVIEVAGPGNLPDPVTSKARYTMTIEVRTRR